MTAAEPEGPGPARARDIVDRIEGEIADSSSEASKEDGRDEDRVPEVPGSGEPPD